MIDVCKNEEYQAICRGEADLQAPLEPMAVVTLHDIEYRIAHHLRGAYGEFLAVGRCLVEAKEGDLVPHGQWEEWVRRNTGMTERQAQRVMQAARNTPVGSALERLPLSKITALLLVADPQEREDLAARALAENTTVRALREEISALNGRVKMAQAANDKLRESQREAVQQATENAKSAVAQAKLDYQTMIDKLQKQLEQQEGEMDRLQGFAQAKVQEIMELKKHPNASGQLSPEVSEEIQRLRQELEEAEAYAARQAEARQAAQRELLDIQSQAARGELGESASAFDLGAAVRAFIGVAGVMPHMGASLAALEETQRQELAQYVDMISTWVEGARRALGTVLVPMA